jgi:hypothetical protein
VKTLLALALFLPLAAHADPVSTLERGMKYAKGTELSVGMRRSDVLLRPQAGAHGVIGIQKLTSQTGFFLQADGKLSAADHAALGTALEKNGTDVRRQVVLGLKQALTAQRAADAHVVTVSPKIDAMLSAAKLAPTKAQVINRRLSYMQTASGPTIIVDGRGYFLDNFKLSDEGRAAVASAL